ncbi:MAG TPA: DUF6470 family protein [Pseudogracilibacillus sp.]|nr:DUF6470 family protein [Pseudogracilibacillus sp.]
MQVPQIRMESQMARISMEQDHGMLEIEQPKAELSIQQPKADMSIQTTKGKLTIDQTEAWQQVNLGSTQYMIEKNARAAMQAASEGTARRAEQGAEMLDIHHGREVFADQAVTNQGKQYQSPNVGYMPSPFSVKINYEKGQVDINFQENKPQIDVQINKPQVTYHRSKVNIAMERYAQLDIDYVNLFK